MLKAWYTLPFILPLYLWRISIGGLPTNVLELVIVGLFLGTVIQYRHLGLALIWPEKGDGRWCLLLIGLSVSLGVIVAPDNLAALGYAKSYFAIPYLVLMGMLASNEERVPLNYLWLNLGGVVALLVSVGVWQMVSGQGLPAPWDYDLRATSVFPYPNALGLFLAPVGSALLAYGLRAKKWWGLVGFLVTVLGVLIARTEAGLVAMAATALFILWSEPSLKKYRPGLVGVSSLLVGLMLVISPVREKLLLQDYSGGVRRSQWVEAVDFLWDHPLLGAGLGGYPVAIESYHQATDFEIFQYPHNILLNQWVELGLLGVVILLVALWWFGKSLFKSDPESWPAKMALLTMVIHGLVDVPFYKNDLAVLTALLLAVIFGCKKGPAELPRPVWPK